MERIIIAIKGELDIGHANEIKETLLRSINGDLPLSLDLSQAISADSAGLQLLCALHKSMSALGTTLEIQGNIPVSIRRAAITAGFARENGCLSQCKSPCLWVQKRTYE